MNKLEKALAGLGLKQSFFDELKADIEAERIITENGLLPITKEDVKDELEQLDTEVDTDPIDEDDDTIKIANTLDYEDWEGKSEDKPVPYGITAFPKGCVVDVTYL